MSERDAGDPFAGVFGVQRRAATQTRQLAHQSAEVQRQFLRLAARETDAQRSLQKKGVDVGRTALESYVDLLAGTVPMDPSVVDGLHDAIAEQASATAELTDWTWDAVRSGIEDGTETYDRLLDDYLDAVDGSVEMYVRTLDGADR